MSCTPPPPNPLYTVRRDRNWRFLKMHIITHELILVTTVITHMLLIAHTATTHGMQPSGLPQKWLDAFVHQLLEGTKRFTWIIIHILIPFDILHALLCIGWHSNQLYPDVRYKDEERRQKRRVRLKRYYGQIATCMQRRFGWDRNGRQVSAKELQGPANDTTRQKTSFAAEIRPPKRTRRMKSQPAPHYPPTYHPLLYPGLSTVQRLALLTLWDVIMILTLSSHIYIFLTNIKPSLANCRSPILAHASSPNGLSIPHDPRSDSPSLNLKDKCHRLNWRIHSAGGYSAGGAAILGAIHVFTLTYRLWEHIEAKQSFTLQKMALGRLERFSRAKKPVSLGEQHWRNPPRDIDVRSLAPHGRDSSSSQSLQVYYPSTMTVTAMMTRHQPTISQEESNAGVLQRGGVGMRSRQQESENVAHPREHSRWQTLLDTLIP